MPIEIVPPNVHLNFIGRWRQALVLSVAALLLGAAGAAVRGVQFGIDFAGGTEIQIRLPSQRVDEGAIRRVVRDVGVEDASVVSFGSETGHEYLIRFASESLDVDDAAPSVPGGEAPERVPAATEEGTDATPSPEEGETTGPAPKTAGADVQDARPDWVDRLEAALDAEFGDLEVLRVEFVGPRVGAELRRKGLEALAYACLLILIYIGFRFSLRFAPGAVLALIHDVLITAGIWALMGEEFNLQVLAALLAILGYSLNDTIILYDRIRENMAIHTKHDLPEVLNRSVNQTLSRTLLTSGTTLLAVSTLIALGGEVIRPFSLAMAIGILVGTYSSIYIAAPTLLVLERRFGASR